MTDPINAAYAFAVIYFLIVLYFRALEFCIEIAVAQKPKLQGICYRYRVDLDDYARTLNNQKSERNKCA